MIDLVERIDRWIDINNINPVTSLLLHSDDKEAVLRNCRLKGFKEFAFVDIEGANGETYVVPSVYGLPIKFLGEKV